MLGISYETGSGAPRDMKLAEYWFMKAAKSGDSIAGRYLGRLYAFGDGVVKDLVQNHMWFNLSALAGDEEARKGRDTVEGFMTAGDIAEAQRFARDWQPIREQSSEAKSPDSSEALETTE